MLSRALPLCAAAAALLLAACASNPPALESTLRVWDLGAVEADAIGSWRSQLVSGVGTDWARKVLCRPDGACAFFGSSRGSFGPSTDFLAMGEIPDQRFQWARTYGGQETDELDGAAAAADGGYLLFGTSASRFGATGPGALPAVAPRPLLIRIAPAGAPLWARTLDAGGIERFHDGAAAGDGVVLVGYAGLGGDAPSVAAARFGRDGALEWAQAFDLGGPGYAVAVAPAANGGVVLAGYLRTANVSFGGTSFLLALDSSGRPLWARRYDMEAPAQPRALVPGPDGGVVIVGTLLGARPARSPFLLRVGPDGTPQMGREFRGLEAIEAFAAADAGERSVVVAGRRRDRFTDRQWGFAMLVDDRGRIIAHATLRAQGSVEFPSVATARAGEYRVTGSTNSFGAAGLDILTGAWLPAGAGGVAQVASGIAERELAVKRGEVTARAQALPVRSTAVALDALEVRTLDVPGSAMPRVR
jgi:hypothetical protein